jgi:hypothetical protein
MLLVSPVLAYCVWVGYLCYAAPNILVWQHFICLRSTASKWLNYCWQGVEQLKNTKKKYILFIYWLMYQSLRFNFKKCGVLGKVPWTKVITWRLNLHLQLISAHMFCIQCGFPIPKGDCCTHWGVLYPRNWNNNLTIILVIQQVEKHCRCKK